MTSDLIARLRDVPEGDARPLYFDTMEEAAGRLEALYSVAEAMLEDYQTSALHHPGHVLVPVGAFNDLKALVWGLGVPYYCRPCSEELTNTQAVCPFCGRDATPIDDLPFVCGKGGCPLGGDL